MVHLLATEEIEIDLNAKALLFEKKVQGKKKERASSNMTDQSVVVVTLPEIKRLSAGTVIPNPVIDGSLIVNGVIQADGITLNQQVTNPQTDPVLAPNTLWNNAGTLYLGPNPVVPSTALVQYTATAVWAPSNLSSKIAGLAPDPLPMTSTLPALLRTIDFTRIGRMVFAQFRSPFVFESDSAGQPSVYRYADFTLTIPVGFRVAGARDWGQPVNALSASVSIEDVLVELTVFNGGGMRLSTPESFTDPDNDGFFSDNVYTTDPATQVTSMVWMTDDPEP